MDDDIFEEIDAFANLSDEEMDELIDGALN